MKKIKYSILLFLLISAYLYSTEPLVKFYLQDGSTKQYNLSEIDSLNVIDKKNNYVLRIHYDDTLIAYYPTEIIGSIKFENGMLNVYIFSYPKTYKLSSIDSLVFYIDQWQPLTIGTQVWMLKNLNVDHYQNGDSIPEVRDDDWGILNAGAWCYYNNTDSLGNIYGKLYNCYAVNDPRGLTPTSWHVPFDYEWKTLELYLGMTQTEADSLGLRGTDEGGKLKETGTAHWLSPNFATNSSGFSALPGGYRDWGTGTYYFVGIEGKWWSWTAEDASSMWYRGLNYNSSSVGRYKHFKEYGFSLRCVKDS